MILKILEHVDFKRANALLEGFNKSTGFVTAILDLDGNILSQSGWRQICTDFHRKNSETASNCLVSDTSLGNNRCNEKYLFYQCMNGLIDVRLPIVIRGEHIANLFSGQFFFEEPDISFFKKQAKTYGFEERAYLEALEKVPVVSKDKVETAMGFLLDITQLFIEMTADKIEQIEINEAIKKNEAALSESQVLLKENLKDLLESQRIAHLGTWRLDLATNQVVWSEELYKMYDFDPTIPPPPYTEHMKLFTSESWKRLSAALERTSTTGIPYELELETLTKDGSNGWMWVRGEAETDSEGNIVSLWGAAQDITAYKNIEREIKQSEERFQLLFNKAPLGYQSLDSEGYFIDVNQQWLDTLGYSKEEVVGKWFGDFLCPEYVDGFRKRFPIFKSQGYIHSEFEMLSKDGRRLYMAFEGKIGYGANGEFKQTHCILQDITNQRMAEQALIESEERYRCLFEYAGVGIGYYATDGVVISYNQKALEHIGGELEDFVGKSIQEIFPREDTEKFFARMESAVSNDQPRQYEDSIISSTGLKWFSSTYTNVMNSGGEVIGVQIASLDITDRKHMEEALRKSEERFRVAQEISPDGFTILHPVRNQTGEIIDFTFVYENQAIARLNQTDPQKVIGKRLLDLFPTHKGTSIFEAYIHVANTGKPQIIEEINIGELISEPKWLRLVVISMGEEIAILAQDITDRKKIENELLFLSYHDHLTGLGNRRFFEEELKRLDTEENLPLSVIMLDVNGLKVVNDSFGHESGDELLKSVAEIIKKVSRGGDFIGRIGGDEFVVLMPKTTAEESVKIANLIKELASKKTVTTIELSISYGYDTKKAKKQLMIETIANAENHMYRHKLYEQLSLRSKTIDIIMNTLFEKSNREAEHSNRVSSICQAIASKMDFDKDAINQIRIAGLIHDIGKIGVDEKILNKAGTLNIDERRDVERHPEIGWRVLNSSIDFSELAEFVLNHHEKWDGSGYPNGLKGEAIKREARIISVADAYDAMTSERSYRKPLNKEDAIRELKKCSGSQFDPEIVDVFLKKVLVHNADA